MVYAGVNGFRLNFSHGTYDERDEQIRIIRKYAAERGKSVAILQDLQGPKIRFGDVNDNHVDMHIGDEFILDNAVKEQSGNVLPVQYNLAEKVKVGEPISFFDGKVKATIKIALDEDESSVKSKALEAVASLLDGKNVVKEIYVKNKIYNIVVK